MFDTCAQHSKLDSRFKFQDLVYVFQTKTFQYLSIEIKPSTRTDTMVLCEIDLDYTGSIRW